MTSKELLKTVGKKLRESKSEIDKTKSYSIEEAILLLRRINKVNFDPTLEIVAKLGVDPKSETVRGIAALPAGTGRTVRIAVICKEEKIEEFKNTGADIVGSMDIVDNIAAGNIDFDICITTPDMMGTIGRVAKILGPKGLMPNPKLGTVTMDVATAVKNARSGQVEYRIEKAGIIHAGIGKISFETKGLTDNVNTIIQAIVKSKPATSKGIYLKTVFLSTTMGPSVKIDLSSIAYQ